MNPCALMTDGGVASYRVRAMKAAHARMVDQAYWVWIAHDMNTRAMSPKVQGFVQARNWFQDLTPVYIK